MALFEGSVLPAGFMNSLNPHECMGWREALSSPHPADEETEARRGRAACPKLQCPQAERGLPRTCLTAEPVYGHFDLYPDCVLGFRGSIRARQEAWGGLRVAGPQRGLDLLRLKVPLFCRAVSCLSTRLPPSTAMVSVKLGPANFSSCPNGSSQWIWDVLGECAQDGWDKASVGLGLLSILCFAASTFP